MPAEIAMNLPNYITAARMIGTLCLLPVQPLSPAFYGLCTLTGFTDILDGWIARKTCSTSEFGAKWTASLQAVIRRRRKVIF